MCGVGGVWMCGVGGVPTLTRDPDVEGAVIAHLSLFNWSRCNITLLATHVTHTHTHTHTQCLPYSSVVLRAGLRTCLHYSVQYSVSI